MKKIFIFLLPFYFIACEKLSIDQDVVGKWAYKTENNTPLQCATVPSTDGDKNGDCFKEAEKFEPAIYAQAKNFPLPSEGGTNANGNNKWDTGYFVNKISLELDKDAYATVKLEVKEVYIEKNSQGQMITTDKSFDRIGSTLRGGFQTFLVDDRKFIQITTAKFSIYSQYTVENGVLKLLGDKTKTIVKVTEASDPEDSVTHAFNFSELKRE